MTLALIKTPKCNYINFKRAISTIFLNDQVFNFSRKMMKKKTTNGEYTTVVVHLPEF